MAWKQPLKILIRFTAWWSRYQDQIFESGEIVMGDKGSKDKGKRERQKKAALSLKEKRVQKNNKIKKRTATDST